MKMYPLWLMGLFLSRFRSGSASSLPLSSCTSHVWENIEPTSEEHNTHQNQKWSPDSSDFSQLPHKKTQKEIQKWQRSWSLSLIHFSRHIHLWIIVSSPSKRIIHSNVLLTLLSEYPPKERSFSLLFEHFLCFFISTFDKKRILQKLVIIQPVKLRTYIHDVFSRVDWADFILWEHDIDSLLEDIISIREKGFLPIERE